MNATSPTPDHPQGPAPTSRAGLFTIGALLVAGMVYITLGTQEGRSEGLPSLLAEYAAWIALLTVAMIRSPGGTLRMSDPFLVLLGMGFNFLVTPGILWLHGADLELHWGEVGRIRMDIFIQLQWLHVMFMVALSAVYFAMAPPHRFRAVSAGDLARLPRPAPWIVLGLLPLMFGVAQRVITTGSIAASQNYGQMWGSNHAELVAVHAEGGSALVASQLLGKVWFLPWLALGIGEGLLLARLVRSGRRLPIVLFVLQAPVLLFLSFGGRSVIAAPFIIAIVVADVLVGPLRWRWVLALTGTALVGFNFFGIYRGYRERDFGEAMALANERFGATPRTENLSAESGIMLIKEHFIVAWSDANNFVRGVSYFTESILGLLPQQLVPEKVRYLNTATFLSRELLGPAASSGGGGVAGSIIADGYMIGRELGTIVLGAVLGAIAGAITRALSAGGRQVGSGPMLWQVVLLVSWSLQGIGFFRNDLSGVISQLLSVLLIPAVLFALWVGMAPDSRWARRVSSSP